MVATTENPHLEFIGRVSNLPVVTTALSCATEVYDKAKESNVLVKKTLNTAEVTAKFAVEQAAPVVTMLEKPLTMMDSLACKGLDEVQEKLPVITKSPQEIVDSAKTYGVQKVDDLKSVVAAAGNYSYSTATSFIDNKYGMMALDGVNWTVTVADKYVDRFLPAEEGQETGTEETQPSTDEDLTVEEKVNQSVQGVVNVSSKVQQCLYTTAVSKLKEIQLCSLETVKSFALAIDLIKYVKDSLNTGSTTAIDEAKHIWKELNKEVGEGDEKLDVYAMNTARRLTRRMVVLCTSARETMQVAPANFRGRIEVILEQALGICNEFAKATTIQELTSLDKLKDRLREVQERLVNVTMYVTTCLTRRFFGNIKTESEAKEMEDKSHEDRSLEAGNVNVEVGTD